MATLQKIRSKGILLVVVVGLALFAFIAGDAWKVMQPHRSQDVGEVNGKALSAQDYQELMEEYSDVVKFSTGRSSLTEEQSDVVKDQVWTAYVNNRLIEDEAAKLGLAVSDAELQSVINSGSHYMLQRTPFTNSQTGSFDVDALNKFLVEYSNLSRSGMNAAYAQQYETVYEYWQYLERSIVQDLLYQKYNALITKSILSNPVEARNSFEGRTTQTDLVVAAVPYSAIPDSTVKVSDAEIKSAYEKKREQYRQNTETRSIRYIDVEVTASEQDRAELLAEVNEYAGQLAEEQPDYSTFVRGTGSQTPYVDIFYSTKSIPSDVVARLDSVKIGQVFGPYYNASDNTFNVFKVLDKSSQPDSIQYRQIQVVENDITHTQDTAKAIYDKLIAGANFDELAAHYGQEQEPVWLTSAYYEGAQIDGDNLKYLNAVLTSKTKEYVNLSLAQGSVIMQVLDRRAFTDKYKVAVVKRTVDFSKETYSKAYNDFSQFIAVNNTVEKLMANAEDAGYRVIPQEDLLSSAHNIGGLKGTKDALRWVYDAKVGEVSGLYECGESDHMLVVGLAGITREGYQPLAAVRSGLRNELLRDKKGDRIIADLEAAKCTTVEQVAGTDDAVSDTVRYVTFSAAAYIRSLHRSEPLVSAHAAETEVGEVAGPIKGNGGVIFLKPYAKNALEEEYSEADEMERLRSTYLRSANLYINDLYTAAKVKDERYLFF